MTFVVFSAPGLVYKYPCYRVCIIIGLFMHSSSCSSHKHSVRNKLTLRFRIEIYEPFCEQCRLRSECKKTCNLILDLHCLIGNYLQPKFTCEIAKYGSSYGLEKSVLTNEGLTLSNTTHF